MIKSPMTSRFQRCYLDDYLAERNHLLKSASMTVDGIFKGGDIFVTVIPTQVLIQGSNGSKLYPREEPQTNLQPLHSRIFYECVVNHAFPHSSLRIALSVNGATRECSCHVGATHSPQASAGALIYELVLSFHPLSSTGNHPRQQTDSFCAFGHRERILLRHYSEHP